MLDFNTKKRILKKLSDKAEKNFLLLIPCLIAAAFVKLYYFIGCNLGIALSDKEGNFLGVKREEREKAPKRKKQDDIIYVRRPFSTRFVSVVLAFAFVGMFIPAGMLPAITASAIRPTQTGAKTMDKYVLASQFGRPGGGIDTSSMDNRSDYYIDVSFNPTAGGYITVPLDQDAPNSFKNRPEIVAADCVFGSTSAKLAWTYPIYGSWRVTNPPNASTDNDTHMTVNNRFEVWAEGRDASGTLRDQKVQSITVDNTNKLDHSVLQNAPFTTYTFTGLNSELSYQFYVKFFEQIHAYSIPRGANLEDYAYYIDPDDYDRAAKGDPILGTIVIQTRDNAANRKSITGKDLPQNMTAGVNTRMLYEVRSLLYPATLTPNDPELIVSAEYVDDEKNNGRIDVRPEKNPNYTIDGYIIYRSEEDVANGGKMTDYEVKEIIPAKRFSGVYSDTDVKLTRKYSYVVVSYRDVYGGSGDYSEKNKDMFITSMHPVGASYGGSTAEASVYTKTEAPSGVAVRNNNTYFTVIWNPVDNATGYNVIRIDKDTGSEKTIASNLDPTQVYYDDRTVTIDDQFYYAVEAINRPNSGLGPNGKKIARSRQVLSDVLDPVIYVPVITDIISSGVNNSAVIQWECLGADVTGFEFEVIRIEVDEKGRPIYDRNGNFIPVEDDTAAMNVARTLNSNTKASNFNPVADQVTANLVHYETTAYGFDMGKTYAVRIRSYLDVNGKTRRSEFFPNPGYAIKIGTELVPTEEIYAHSLDGHQIRVFWQAVKDAHHYILEIYKVNPNSVFLDKVGERTIPAPANGATPEYYHTNLKDGDTYLYRVRTVRKLLGVEEESKPGDYAIATVGKKTLSPTDLVVVPDGNNLKVSWKEPSMGADGYLLEISYNGKTEVKDYTAKEYLHRNPQYGVRYTYRVRAYKNIIFPDGTAMKYTSDYSSEEYYTIGGGGGNSGGGSGGGGNAPTPGAGVVDTSGIIGTPTGLVALPGEGFALLSWNPVAGAAGYYVYATSNGRTEIFIADSPIYEHMNLTPGTEYSYYVEAYTFFNGTLLRSYPSAIAKVIIAGYVVTPLDFNVVSADTSATLSWTAVKGVDGYTVYGVSGSGQRLEVDVSKTSYTHVGLVTGDTWTYYVRAFRIINYRKVYSETTNSVTVTIGSSLPSPTDFAVVASEASALLTWTAVKAATGYTVHGVSDTGKTLEIDVSKNTYIHPGLITGESWTYYVRAFRTVNNQKVYSVATTTITVKIGMVLPAPTDLTAVAESRSVQLSWTAVKSADGYVVYQYDEASTSFLPVQIVSKPEFLHTSLKNGKRYTYMVAAYRTLNNERTIGDYSLAVSAIPSSGDASNVDTIINIKGTAPYGIPHTELINAAANHEAFDIPVDAYISISDSSTRAVKQVLRNYAGGLKSFMIYPFDIKTYEENTLIEVAPNDGFTITFTIPVPEKMVNYRDYITVIHLKEDGTATLYDDEDDDIFVASNEFEVLPSAIVNKNGTWCIQFQTTSCSPFAFVIYRDNLSDVAAGAPAASQGSSAGGFNTGLLLFTALPDILPAEKKTKFVVSAKKRYRIKK